MPVFSHVGSIMEHTNNLYVELIAHHPQPGEERWLTGALEFQQRELEEAQKLVTMARERQKMDTNPGFNASEEACQGIREYITKTATAEKAALKLLEEKHVLRTSGNLSEEECSNLITEIIELEAKVDELGAQHVQYHVWLNDRRQTPESLEAMYSTALKFYSAKVTQYQARLQRLQTLQKLVFDPEFEDARNASEKL